MINQGNQTMTYRVHFPGLTQNLSRDFQDEDEALRFAAIRRDAAGSMWRHVRMEKILNKEPYISYRNPRRFSSI
jgi:hypothetical protein